MSKVITNAEGDPLSKEELYDLNLRENRIWGILAVLMMLAYSAYMIHWIISKEGFNLDESYFGNKRLFGLVVSSFSFAGPALMLLLWWTGALAAIVSNRLYRIGICALALAAGVTVLWHSWHDVNRMWNDSDQQLGMVIGLLTCLTIVTSVKLLVMSIKGRPHHKFRGKHSPPSS